MSEQELHRLWRDQPAAAESFDPQELRRKADDWHRVVSKRNRREYVAGAIAALAFLWFAVSAHDAWTRIGCITAIAGLVIALYQLHRRAAAAEPDPAEFGTPVALHYRAELCRQRDALRSVWLWYIAPLLPGPAIMLLGPYMSGRSAGGGLNDLIGFLIFAVIMALILWLNSYAASRIQRRIDQLDRSRMENSK